MNADDADAALLSHCFNAIPSELDDALDGVDFEVVADVPALRAILAADYPKGVPNESDPDNAQDNDAPPPGVVPDDARGLFVGLQAEPEDPDDPDCEDFDRAEGVIFLVAANHDDAADLHHTVTHEIAHALGYDEAEAAEMGLG